MSAAYTLVPELRFPEFQVDPGWKERPLGDFLREHKVKSDRKSEVHSVSVHKGVINQKEHLGRSFAAKDTSNYNLAHPNDVIYTKSPTGNFPYGVVKQSRLGSNVIVSPLYGVYTPTSASAGYIVDCYFESPQRAYKYLDPITQKGAKNTIQITNQGFLSGLVLFPDNPAEQQKIADCLGSLDDLIAAHSRKLAALQDHKKGLLQQLFPAEGENTPKLRFPEFEGKWEGKSLKELAVYRRGSFPQPYGNPEWFDEENGTPFIQVYDVAENLRLKPKTKTKISKLGAKKSVFIPEGTLIITIQGSIGRVAITQYDAYIDRTLLLFKEFKQPVCKEFFAQALFLLFEIEKGKAPGGIIKTGSSAKSVGKLRFGQVSKLM